MIHFIGNPTAHGHKSKQLIRYIQTQLNEKKIEYEFHYTKHAEHGKEIAKELSRSECTIVAVGGDGTIHDVLNGIENFSKVKVGIIPTGTGNDFAAAAGIPNKIDKALDIILNGEAKRTDYIEIDGKRSINAAGMGMDVDVLQRAYRGKIFKGKFKYLLSLLQSLVTFKGYSMEIEIDGIKSEHNALFACVCNGSQIGGGIRICPVAVIDDEKLDLVVVEMQSFFGVLGAFVALMNNKLLTTKHCTHILCDKAIIRAHKNTISQLDGELYENLNFTAEIRKDLTLFRP